MIIFKKIDRGFSLIEALISVFILSIVIAGTFMSLRVGEMTFALNPEKIDLQTKSRTIMDWIAKDLRSSVSWNVANSDNDSENPPSDSYLKFRQVTGIDINTGQYLLADSCIEYVYDSSTSALSRNVIDAAGNSTNIWKYTDFSIAPFYTFDSTGSVLPMNKGDLLTSEKVIIRLSARKFIRGNIIMPYDLTAEVKIRNE